MLIGDDYEIGVKTSSPVEAEQQQQQQQQQQQERRHQNSIPGYVESHSPMIPKPQVQNSAFQYEAESDMRRENVLQVKQTSFHFDKGAAVVADVGHATRKKQHPDRTRLQTIWANLVLSFHYTRTDVGRRPRNCFLGFLAVFLVVFFTALVLAAISKTSYLLLRFAEVSAGEMDAVIYATDGVPVVNFTAVNQRLAINASATVSGAAPRWIARGVLRSWSEVVQKRADAQDIGGAVNLSGVASLAVNILVVDAVREPSVGIGRAWPYRQIGYGETQVTDTALEFLRIRSNAGDRSTLVIELQALLEGQSVELPDSVALPGASFNVTTAQATAVEDALTALGLNVSALVNASSAGGDTQLTVNGATVNVSNFLSPMLDFNVAEGITEGFGKFPTALGNVMLVDYHQLIRLTEDQSCASGSTVFTADGGATTALPSPLQALGLSNSINSIDLADYALLVVAMFHNRFETYYKKDTELANDMIRNSNEMLLALDYRFPGQILYPIAQIMEGFQSFNAILTSMFAATVIVIIVLSAILVYSLLGTNGEERQYELSMIRTQGMTKHQLLYIMTAEVLAFTIPGVICGIGLVLAANAVLEKVLSDFAWTPYEPLRLPIVSLVFAGVAGFALPVVSNYSPVMEAFQTSLREALDINRQKWSETQVTMLKLEELGLAPWQICFGAFLVVAGFMVYYLLPLSFLFNNLLMFFVIMNIILLTMLFGLCLLVYGLQGYFERAWLWAMMWGGDKRLHTLVAKNMEAHSSRNRRAFMMFVVSIACVIFGGIAFDMMAETLIQLLELSTGADFVISSTSFSNPLNSTALTAYLESQRGISVAAWSFITFQLSDYPQLRGLASEALVNILGKSQSIPLVGVTESFLDAAFPKYVLVQQTGSGYSFGTSSTGAIDVVRSLYTDPQPSIVGQAKVLYTGFPENITAPDAVEKVKTVMPILVASGVQRSLGLDTSGLGAVEFTYRLENGLTQQTEFLVQPRALLGRFPGFPGISPRTFALGAGAMIVTIENFRRLVTANETDFFGIPPNANGGYSTNLAGDAVTEAVYERLFVRVQPGISERERTFFLNSLQSYLDSYYSNSVNVFEVVKTVKQVAQLMYAFYYFSAAISVLLASFMTWLVFVSNVTQNAWSFGVLRSLGFTKAHVLRSVVYEALALVLSSFTVGVPIGVFVGFTLGLQLNTFLNLPFEFNMPYPLLITLLGISLLAATAGSWLPMRQLNKLCIALALKKYN